MIISIADARVFRVLWYLIDWNIEGELQVACGAHVESPHGDPEAIAKVPPLTSIIAPAQRATHTALHYLSL